MYKKDVEQMKFIKKLLFTIILIFIAIVCYIVYTGYNMYNEAILATSISDKISEIQNNDNYVKFDDIPDDFKNAIVAVEDHRFYNHNGIDLITTTRSMIENIKEKDIVAGGSTITQQVRTTFVFYTRTTFF
jgi:membrane peptidoglycan carboxypeptidase